MTGAKGEKENNFKLQNCAMLRGNGFKRQYDSRCMMKYKCSDVCSMYSQNCWSMNGNVRHGP